MAIGMYQYFSSSKLNSTDWCPNCRIHLALVDQDGKIALCPICIDEIDGPFVRNKIREDIETFREKCQNKEYPYT